MLVPPAGGKGSQIGCGKGQRENRIRQVGSGKELGASAVQIWYLIIRRRRQCLPTIH